MIPMTHHQSTDPTTVVKTVVLGWISSSVLFWRLSLGLASDSFSRHMANKLAIYTIELRGWGETLWLAAPPIIIFGAPRRKPEERGYGNICVKIETGAFEVHQ
jgi:hypothetical protein